LGDDDGLVSEHPGGEAGELSCDENVVVLLEDAIGVGVFVGIGVIVGVDVGVGVAVGKTAS